MDSDIIRDLNKAFENAANDIDGLECWLARDIAPLLGYDRWENFSKTIDRAKTSCTQGGQAIEDHFRDVTKMVPLGSGAERSIDDVILTRYACYLIAQNGDPRKEQIAFAQSYFALQTRKQEILEERLALAERLARAKSSSRRRPSSPKPSTSAASTIGASVGSAARATLLCSVAIPPPR